MSATLAEKSAIRTRLHLFGPFRLEDGDADCPSIGRKARAILAYLVLVPGFSATREHLSALLWSDRANEQARASLRQCIKELRSLPLGQPAIHANRDAVSLDRTALVVDLHEIRSAAAARDLPALAELLEGIAGDLMEDFMDLSPAFDEWLMAERPRQHDILLADICEAVEECGTKDVREARAILRSLDRLDPTNEAVARLALKLDHAEGDNAALHRRFQLLSERLDREYGAPPSAETKALYNELTSISAPAPPAQEVSRAEAQRVPIKIHSRGEDMLPLVMVTPLETAGSDPALEASLDFCADDVRISLSRNRGLRVLSVEDADLAETIRQGEDALGLYLLRWNARKVGEALRVTMQLVNASGRVIVWSDTLSFAEADEQMVETIVEKASGAISPAIDRDLDALLLRGFEEFDEERTLYTRARLLIRRVGTLEAVREAVELLERLIERNPRHLEARLLLTRMYATDFWQQIAGHDVARFRDRADEHLRAASAIEPTNCEVRIRQGWSLLRQGQIDAARVEFEAVLQHLPRDADMIDMCAFGMCHIGLYDAADRLMQRAFFLNPFPPSDYHADYAVLLALRGEAAMAEEHFVLSGETGLQYLAVRIANSVSVAHGDARIGEARKLFERKFRDAWQEDREPRIEDVLAWFGDTMPLYPADRLEWVETGLKQMLGPTWQAAEGSGA